MSDIYNKNAREKALLEEAYSNIYKEEFNPRRDAPEHSKGDPHPAQRAAEALIGAEVMWDGMMKRGRVDEVDVENGVAVVIADDDGGEHIVQLGDFDVVLPVEDGEDSYEQERKDNIEYSKRHGEINVFDHLAKYVAEIAEDIIIDNPDEQVAPEAAFEMAVEMIETDLKNIKYEDVKDKLDSFYETNPELTRGMKPTGEEHGGHDYESWHEFMRDYEEHGN